MNSFTQGLLIAIGGFVVIAVIAVLGGTIVWALWDNVMPKLFGLPDIGWWEAVSLSWITGILFRPVVNNRLEKK